MKSGVRALGVAESYRAGRSTLAGAVVRADRVVDGFAFGSCTVGGTDATDSIVSLFDRLDRPDVRFLLVAGIAPAWFNVLDLHALHDAVGIPVLSVSFEESEGLTADIEDAFEGTDRERRLVTYRAQPDRHAVAVDGETVFVRSVGLPAASESSGETTAQTAADVVRAFTQEGGRPEPLRVARLAARAVDAARRDPGATGLGGPHFDAGVGPD